MQSGVWGVLTHLVLDVRREKLGEPLLSKV